MPDDPLSLTRRDAGVERLFAEATGVPVAVLRSEGMLSREELVTLDAGGWISGPCLAPATLAVPVTVPGQPVIGVTGGPDDSDEVSGG